MYAPYPQPAAPAPPKSNGLAIASLVLGIVALLLSWIPFVGFLGFILGIVGVVLGVIGLAKSHRILSAVGTALSALAIIISIAVWVATLNAVDDAIKDVNRGAEAVSQPEPSDPGVIASGPALLTVGETAVIEDDLSGGTGKVTVTEVALQRSVTNHGFTETAANGYFMTIHVTITNTGPGGFNYNPLNYVVVTDGHQFNSYGGNSMMVGDIGSRLSSGTLAPGTSTEGDITFDVSATSGKILYVPNLDGRPIAVWTFGTGGQAATGTSTG